MVRPRFVLRARVIAIALLSAASWGAPARAQGPGVTFGETIDVKVINVEVVVTDREGRRVTGLGPGDFRLTVDGEEKPIDYFTEVREGRAVKRDDGATRAAAGLEGGVAALRPGLEVRSRQGYLDFSREAEVTAAVESLLFLEQAGGIAAEPLPIRPGAAERSGRKTLDLSLTLGIPVDRITMLPAGEGWVGDLELRVVTLDVNGDRSDVVTVPLHLESQTEPSPGGLVRYDTSLTLRRIEQEVVVSVFDPLSGRLLASRLQIDPKALLAGS